jgi:hypothetical protein
VEHLYNPDAALDEFHRVLKNNGLLILSTPNLASWYNRILLLFGIQPYYMETSTVDKTVGLKFIKNLGASTIPVGHVRIFTLTAIKDLLELHGFETLEVVGLPGLSLPQPMLIVDRYLSKIPGICSDPMLIARKMVR